ncbi:MAG TPA: protein kinase [Planctomycetota bacterium]
MSGEASSERDGRAARALRGLARHEDERARLPRIPRFEIRGKLGEGAAAVVYRAWDRELDRPVALKVLRELAGFDDTARARFKREAQVMGSLSHPNIVAVHDAGDVDGQLYIVMELVEGRTLADVLKDPAVDAAARLRLLEKAARAVDAAHARQIVHRDLKPGNILVAADGEPKVADFGLAQLAGADVGLTRTGAVLGTPLYMSPEQVRGSAGAILLKADVYALGAILYEILAGRPPHTGATLPEVYAKILNDDPAPLGGPLGAVAQKALERDPHARYPSAAAFADELKRHLAGEPVEARPARVWKTLVKRRRILVVALAAVALGAWGVAVRRAGERQTRALELLEAARPPIEKGVAAQYRATSTYEEIERLSDEARALVERAIALSPELALAHYRMGEVHELRGDYERAQASWTEAIRLGPGFGAARYRLGRVLLWRAHLASLYLWSDEKESNRAGAEDLARAGAKEIEAARAAGSGFDNDLRERVAAAMLAHLRGEVKDVDTLCREGIRRFAGAPGVEDFHWLLGLGAKLAERQVEAYSEAIRLRPKFPLALYGRGHAYALLGRKDAALRDYEEVLRAMPSCAEAVLSRGDVRFAQGDGPGAVADYDELIRRGAFLPAAYNGRGRTRQTHLGDLDGALQDLTEAIRLKPRNNPLPYMARAQIRLARGDFAGAVDDSTRAMEDARWPDHYLIRGQARLAQGDRDGAIADLEQARKLTGPADPLWPRIEASLAEAKKAR